MKSKTKFTYANPTDKVVRLTVEPWADQFVIQPGQKVEIEVCGAGADAAIEFEHRPDGLTVFGSEGSTIRVCSNGKELPPESQQ